METLTGKALSERAALVLAVPLAHALGIRLLDDADPATAAGETVARATLTKSTVRWA